MSEELTEQKPAITLEEAKFCLNEIYEVAAAMKQCNPNMTPIRAMILDRWRNILWEKIPIVQLFINQHFAEKPVEVKPSRVIKVPVKQKRVINIPPRKLIKR